jgi:hypothetical protein
MAKQEQKSRTPKKRGRGRPPGRTYAETIPLRVTLDMRSEIEAWKGKNGIESFNDALRQLIERGLKR